MPELPQSKSVILLLILWVFVCMPPITGNAQDSQSRSPLTASTLSILYTGDSQAFLKTCGCSPNVYTNLNHRDAEIERLSTNVQHRILLDLGGIFAGNTQEDQDRSLKYLQALKIMSYDVVLISSSEFTHGIEFLKKHAENYRFLSSNITLTDQQTPWISKAIVNCNGILVGVFGLTMHSHTLQFPGNDQVKRHDSREVVLQSVTLLRQEGAHIVLCLSDLSALENADILSYTSGIDILLTGHSQEDFIQIGTSLAASGCQFGKNMGEIQVSMPDSGQTHGFRFDKNRLHPISTGINPVLPVKRIFRKVMGGIAQTEMHSVVYR